MSIERRRNFSEKVDRRTVMSRAESVVKVLASEVNSSDHIYYDQNGDEFEIEKVIPFGNDERMIFLKGVQDGSTTRTYAKDDLVPVIPRVWNKREEDKP